MNMLSRILIVIALLFPAVALAQSLDAGVSVAAPALPDASAPQAAPPQPADKLHDPASSPGAAWDDVKAAKKVGWATLVFVVLVMLAKLASRAGSSVKWLAVLGQGKIAVIIGALGALGAACYNAAADGGAWTAMLMAGLLAIGHYVDAAKAGA